MAKNPLEATAAPRVGKAMMQTVDEFLRHLEAESYSPVTVKGYGYAMKPFLAFLAESNIKRFPQVTMDTILSYQDHIHHRHTSRYTGKPVSAYHQRNLLAVLKVFFRYLLRRGKILSDPTNLMLFPRIPKRLPRDILTKREMRKLLKVCDLSTPHGYRDRVIFEILYATGIRRDELRNLTLYDVDTQKRELVVRLGKGAKDRVIPLAKKAAEVIERYVTDHRRHLLDPVKPDQGYLLLNSYGTQLSRDFSTDFLRKYTKKTKITKKITTHSFRHTMATHLLKNKASIRAIQELLGHEQLSSTQIYTKVEVGDLRKVIDKAHPREKME
jgi:integrase/recombinase XerD